MLLEPFAKIGLSLEKCGLHPKRPPHFSVPFNTLMMALIVFQLRVVADTPRRFSSWLKKPIVRMDRRYCPKANLP
jgi:hypothetical protein